MRPFRAEHPSLEQLSAYLDQELPGNEQEWVQVHLDGCAPCRQRFDELQGVAGGMRGLRRVEPPQSLDLWVSQSIEFAGHRENLMDQLEGRLRGISSPQSYFLPLFAVIIMLAVVSYFFAYGFDSHHGQVLTPVYFPTDGGMLIDNRPSQSPPPLNHRTWAAGRSLTWDGERWVEEGLRLDDLANARVIWVDSVEGRRLLAEGSELAEMAKARRPVVVRMGPEVIELRATQPVPLPPEEAAHRSEGSSAP